MYATEETGVNLSVLSDGNVVARPATPSTGGWGTTKETYADIAVPLSGVHKITYAYTGSADLYSMWFDKTEIIYSETVTDESHSYVTYVDAENADTNLEVITAAYASDGRLISVTKGSSVREKNLIKNTAVIANDSSISSISTFIWYAGTVQPFADKKTY